MDTRRCFRIADRIDAGLRRELGQGIDRESMVREPLYARDVLLVCDGMRGSELARHAQQFRLALVAAEPSLEAEATAGRRDGAGFSPSRFLNSLFGPSSSFGDAAADDPPPPKRSGWFSGSGNARK